MSVSIDDSWRGATERLATLRRQVADWSPAATTSALVVNEHRDQARMPAVRTRDEIEAVLDEATYGLWRRHPELSARTTLGSRQRWCLVGALGTVGMLAGLWPVAVASVIASACVLAYLATMVFRLRLFVLSIRSSAIEVVSDEEATAIPSTDLPVYTVLVPVYREPEVAGRLMTALARLDYPAGRLDVKVILEADDHPTIDAVLASGLPKGVELVVVPVSEPRTKPKALNVGLQTARGEYLTIYDAEDRPDPLQLRRAVVALRRLPDRVACAQALLTYFNPGQNLITRWFGLEYRMWFTQLLPGLAALDAPVPLGGTSNHFRTEVLRQLGGWDPFNVTEDADLGVRMHRAGYRTAVLGSHTAEEANSDFVNWAKQRSRWYKGYLQTWIVHMRRPARLWSELGGRGFVRFNLFVGGTPLLALLNPAFWMLAVVWFVAHPRFVQQMLPGPMYYASLVSWVVGNFLFFYAVLLTAVESDEPAYTVRVVMGVPLYWLMMSVAAVKAFWQLLTAPTHWEKTTHGLDRSLERAA